MLAGRASAAAGEPASFGPGVLPPQPEAWWVYALFRAPRGGAETTVSVADNGAGIDARYHDKIFGIFDQKRRLA